MANSPLTRRDFLKGMGVGGLVYVLQSSSQTVNAAQREEIRGFDVLRRYATRLYDETYSYNYARDEKGNSIQRQGREPRFPFLFEGEISGRKVEVWIVPKLPSEAYSLETKVQFKDDDTPLHSEWADFRKNIPERVFLDYGLKGNLRGRRDMVTNFSVNNDNMEFALYMGNGGYYLAHFILPKINVPESELVEATRKRMQNIFSELAKLRLSEENSKNLLSILTSFDEQPQDYDHSFNFMPSLLDGAAWHIPSGIMQSYFDLSINSRWMRVNVGTQPRLIGSYSKTSTAELRRRRERALQSGNKEYSLVLQKTIDTLVQEGKIKL